MYLTSNKAKTGNFKPVPPGTHLGRLYKIVDIGTQQGEWQGKITHQRKVILHWELFGEDETGAPLTRDDGKPLIITKYYNRSLDERSTLSKHLQAWLKFDPNVNPPRAQDLLGKFAMLSVSNYKTAKGETKASIDGLAAVPTLIAKHGLPEGVNELFLFDLDSFDSDKFSKLSEAVQNMIKQSPEYRALAQRSEPKQESPRDDFDQDIPF